MVSNPIIPLPTTTAVSPSRTGVRLTASTATLTASIIAACSKLRFSGSRYMIRRGTATNSANAPWRRYGPGETRSEEHTSELQHLGISYAVFCLKKKKSQSDLIGQPCFCTQRPSGTPLRVFFALRFPTYTQSPILVSLHLLLMVIFFFFFNNAAPTEFSPFPHPAALPI